ncbi:hypothetical protein R1flu_028853 [Riccia fluitans]|uniref:Uncharacterized protein n=1 Tax=Riccia fluitans TaxID=41844 RepID=A0ABD1XMV6_9MARC
MTDDCLDWSLLKPKLSQHFLLQSGSWEQKDSWITACEDGVLNYAPVCYTLKAFPEEHVGPTHDTGILQRNVLPRNKVDSTCSFKKFSFSCALPATVCRSSSQVCARIASLVPSG